MKRIVHYFQESSRKYQRFGVQIVQQVRYRQEAHDRKSPEKETWGVRRSRAIYQETSSRLELAHRG